MSIFKNKSHNIFEPKQYQDVEIDGPSSFFLNEQQFTKPQYPSTQNIFLSKIQQLQNQQHINYHLTSQAPVPFPLQSKQKLQKFHNQIRSHQRHLIKRQMRLDKFQKDVENNYWNKYLQKAMEEEIQEYQHFCEMAEESRLHEENFWASFGKPQQNNQNQQVDENQSHNQTEYCPQTTRENTDVII